MVTEGRRKGRREKFKRDTGKLLEMMDKFVILVVVIASWCKHVKMYQISQLLTKLVSYCMSIMLIKLIKLFL